ncbi:MAG: HD domain-containing protein [Gemmatimonadetes bacterium]|nr:HD domain-containing protein [Gemmatimonadota bacterium]
MSTATTRPAARELDLPAVDPPIDATAGPVPLLRGLAGLQRATAMYPPGHPMIAQRLKEFAEVVKRHLTQLPPDPHDRLGSHPTIRLDLINGDVYLDGVAFHHENTADAPFARELVDLGIHSIHIADGVTPDELLGVADLLTQFREGKAGETIEDQLARRGVRHVSLGRIVPLDTRWTAPEWADAPVGPLDPDYAKSLAIAEQAFDAVAAGRGVDLVTVRDLVQLLVDKVARSNVALGQILALKQYENLTYCHSVNVATLSLLLGRQLGLDDTLLAALVETGLLHDIGKTRVPLEILKKPGTLDRSERRLIESHTTLGAEMLVETDGLYPLAPTVALEHHRDLTGRGYPDLGDAVPHALTQIVAVADTYEALTGARTYRAPTPPEQACLIMARLGGRRLNSSLVKAFVSAITFFPLGSVVRTSRGETGVVVGTSRTDPLHPVLVLVTDDPDAPRREIDTSARDSSGAYERHIVETLRPDDGRVDLTRILAPPSPGAS